MGSQRVLGKDGKLIVKEGVWQLAGEEGVHKFEKYADSSVETSTLVDAGDFLLSSDQQSRKHDMLSKSLLEFKVVFLSFNSFHHLNRRSANHLNRRSLLSLFEQKNTKWHSALTTWLNLHWRAAPMPPTQRRTWTRRQAATTDFALAKCRPHSACSKAARRRAHLAGVLLAVAVAEAPLLAASPLLHSSVSLRRSQRRLVCNSKSLSLFRSLAFKEFIQTSLGIH